MNIIQQLEQEQIAKLAKTIPDFQPGDTVIVNVKVKEGERSRVPGLRGRLHRPFGRRPPGELHGPQDLLRRRRRARVPDLFAE